MNINDAACAAVLDKNDGITRRSWRSTIIFIMKFDGISMYANGKPWKPQIDDILATDWEAINYIPNTEPIAAEGAQKPLPENNKLSFVSLTAAILSLMVSMLSLLLR